MKLAVLVLLAVLSESSFAAFCTYYRSSNSVTCGSVTCNTASPSDPSEELPSGYYYVGNFYYHSGTPWFNLYPQRRGGGFWDYYTRVPELDCRGGFGLHAGSYSEGCITVTSSSCFNNLKDEINSFRVIYFNVYECPSRWDCWRKNCGSTSNLNILRRPCTTDLQAI